MSSVQYYGTRNVYGYDLQQMRIDYENKQFAVGHFTHLSKSEYITQKAFRNKIDELKKLGFTEITL